LVFITELPATLVPIVPEGFSLSYLHMFIGAVPCATSVGITARVFKDLGKLKTKEAQIILGADERGKTRISFSDLAPAP